MKFVVCLFECLPKATLNVKYFWVNFAERKFLEDCFEWKKIVFLIALTIINHNTSIRASGKRSLYIYKEKEREREQIYEIQVIECLFGF